MSQDHITPELAAALVAAQGDLKPVEKDGYNQHSKYKFASLEGIVSAIKPVLHKHGLALAFSSDRSSALPPIPTRNGGQQLGFQVEATIRIIHSSGGFITGSGVGVGYDVGDKGIYQASTGARKYAILGMLNLGTTDDPERENPPEQQPMHNHMAPPQQQYQQRPPQQQPKRFTPAEIDQGVREYQQASPPQQPQAPVNPLVAQIEESKLGEFAEALSQGIAAKFAEQGATQARVLTKLASQAHGNNVSADSVGWFYQWMSTDDNRHTQAITLLRKVVNAMMRECDQQGIPYTSPGDDIPFI